MPRTKKNYLTVQEALDLGYPDFRGTKKPNGFVFHRYEINPTTNHVSVRYQCPKKQYQANKKSIKKKFDFLKRYKLFCGCSVCGFKEHYAALQFNHTDPSKKKFTISKGYKSAGIKKLKEEMRKCEVLCANCHAMVTMKEGHHMLGDKSGKRKT